jgi:hypothetical protein
VLPPPRLGEVAGVMRDHAERLVASSGETGGMKSFRKHAGWYLTGYPVGGPVRKRANVVATLTDLDGILAELDPAAELAENALRTPRGHSNGPRSVHLPHRWVEDRADPTPPEGAELTVSGG